MTQTSDEKAYWHLEKRPYAVFAGSAWCIAVLPVPMLGCRMPVVKTGQGHGSEGHATGESRLRSVLLLFLVCVHEFSGRFRVAQQVV